ncbi:uncharacterized protein B0H64DRAFT_384407 [Chaetomium fimeti]|uniref:RING-type domain-containing protein n=1 Tax=Chaetomium fimeti TaxID=1854472 RepID=A0AAE0HKM4_9PEZI|nr:hypothetical protein B0H64DRAFT_384407 [Chaetomium fimeti]
MRPPRIAILVLFFAASLFLVCRSISSIRRPSIVTNSSPPQKSSFRALFSFTAPFSLFPPTATISLTDDNSTNFAARPAAFGPPLGINGLKGQLWIGSGFSDETLQEGEGEGELGCSDIPGWEDGRTKLAIKAIVRGSSSTKPHPLAHAVKNLKMNDLGKDPAVGDAVQKKRPHSQTKPTNDGTDDYLHQPLQQTRSPYGKEPTTSGSSHADIQSMQETAEITGKVALLSRGGCGFLEKVKWAQRRGAIALIVGDNQKGGPLIQMFARGDVDNVTIPSVFTSRTTAHLLSSLMQSGSFDNDVLSEKMSPLGKAQHSTNTERNNDVKKAPLSARYVSRASAATVSAGKNTMPKPDKPIVAKRGWLSRLFHWGGGEGTSVETSRPPTSGRLDWVLVDDWDDEPDKLIKTSPDKAGKADANGPSTSSGDGFQIGVHDWRDPDLAGSTAESNEAFNAQGSTNGNGRSSNSETSTEQVDKPDDNPSAEANGPRGGSITPGSGEYVPGTVGNSATPGSGKSQSSSNPRGGLLSKIFGGDDNAEGTEVDTPDMVRDSSATMSPPDILPPAGHVAREGLWVTILPSGNTSPFFDTLLVLVVSPLITLTVVYALLILRVKIRMRRWRAPKSVVDRLPVRTYQTVAPSPAPSPRVPSPTSSSPTTPLLQGPSGSRPRPRATPSGLDSEDLLAADSSTQSSRLPSHEKNSRGISSEWKKHMGRQVECVVCLEEYVDGVSKVMSLPCGHEFHAECITPWLTTRRRTCPICKNDVVRSLARGTSSGPQYEPFHEDGYESPEESSDMFQERIPSPNQLEDLERGPSFTQSVRQDWRGHRHDVWYSTLASRFGGSSSFSTRREGSGEDRGR